ncbi:MAG: YkgJ family cysteine cluster protein [Euryarchaeota archaeon]|nr:YkgJ family cysteine cluster protein [Euryarchaeota archaeon]
MKAISIDLGEVSGCFTCQRCGSCCTSVGRGVRMYYQEVRAIQGYLRGREDVLEELAWDVLTHAGMAELIGSGEVAESFRSLGESFFSSSARSFGSGYFVEYYVLKSFRGACVFFNPLTKECVVHSAKPLVCRLYPYYTTLDLGEMRVRLHQHECPGTGVCEAPASMLALASEALEFARAMQEHYSKLAEMLEGRDAEMVRRNFVERLRYVEVAEEERELEWLRMSRDERVEVRDLFLEHGLIEAGEEYRSNLLYPKGKT